jgi:hypothetical protein
MRFNKYNITISRLLVKIRVHNVCRKGSSNQLKVLRQKTQRKREFWQKTTFRLELQH